MADVKIVKPKLKLSIEFSRSGYLAITKAVVGGAKAAAGHSVNRKQVRKSTQLTEDQLKDANKRVKWYKKRDEDKIKTDVAKNDFEAMIYKLRDWLREDENAPYVEEGERDSYIERLTELEDWLYEDGADANYTVYGGKAKNMTKDFDRFNNRKVLDEERPKSVESARKVLTKILDKVAEMKDAKPWITDEEKKDVTEKLEEVKKWLEETLEAQDKLAKHEDPVFKPADMNKKL